MTSMEKCVSEMRTAVDDGLHASMQCLNGDAISCIPSMLGDITELKNAMTDCKAVQMNDLLMWLDQHTNDNQKKCLQSFISGMIAVKAAEDAWNDSTKSTADKFKA